MSKVFTLFPNYDDSKKVESASFSSMTETQASELCLAFSKAGFHTMCFNSGDKDLNWVVNVKVKQETL